MPEPVFVGYGYLLPGRPKLSMKCALCGEAGSSFIRVRHRKLGIVLLCDACILKEKERLLPFDQRSGCGCG